MKYFFIFILCFYTLNSFSEEKLDLKSLFEEAKQKNLNIQSSKLNQDILSSQKLQVRSALLPSVSLNATFTQFEQSKDYDRRHFDDTSEVITLKGVQRIFSGLKEYYTLKKIQFAINAETLTQQYRELELLTNLAQIYFHIIYQQEKIINIKELLNISIERQQLHSQRVKIGKSRQSELRQATVQTKKYQLTLKEAEMTLQDDWNNLRLITGNDNLKQVNLVQYITSTSTLKPLSYYKELIQNHPLLKAGSESMLSLEEEKKSIKSDFFPTVSIIGNYYSQTYSQSYSNTSVTPEWDFGLTISYPFFEGGLTKSKIAEASLKISQKSHEQMQMRKSLENEVEKVYNTLTTKIDQNKTVEELCADNKKNYLEVKKEYSMGLVSNLDVISSLNTYVESLDQKTQYSIEVQLNTILLKSLTGQEL